MTDKASERDLAITTSNRVNVLHVNGTFTTDKTEAIILEALIKAKKDAVVDLEWESYLKENQIIHAKKKIKDLEAKLAEAQKVVEAARLVARTIKKPGMKDPFDGGWKWKYKLDEALEEYEK